MDHFQHFFPAGIEDYNNNHQQQHQNQQLHHQFNAQQQLRQQEQEQGQQQHLQHHHQNGTYEYVILHQQQAQAQEPPRHQFLDSFAAAGAPAPVPPQHQRHLYHDLSHASVVNNNYPVVVNLPVPGAATATGAIKDPEATMATPTAFSPREEVPADEALLVEDREKTIEEANWQIMLRSLSDWMVRNIGDKRGPTMQDDPELASWVREQRANMELYLQKQVELSKNKKRRKQLQQDQQGKDIAFEKRHIDQLNSIQFDWAEAEFDIMFRQLELFKSKHGTTDVPATCGDRELLRWVHVQRENKARLDALGFKWGDGENDKENDGGENGNDESTNPKQKEINPTAADNKRSDIATASRDANPPKRPRVLVEEYQQMHNPAQGLMKGANGEGSESCDKATNDTAEENRDGMEEANNDTDWGGAGDDDDNSDDEELILAAPVSFKKDWDKLFRKLVRFKKEYGHLKVPVDYQDQRLAKWVDRQRYLLKTNANHLTPAEQHRLKSIGLDQILDLKVSNWEENFQLLVEFRKEHNHCNATRKKGVDNRVAKWIATQRQARRSGKISAERIQRLDEIGFSWDARPEKWEFMFSTLEGFKETHGHCRVPGRHRHDNNLGDWVQTQRRFRRVGRLAEDKIVRLDALGFEWDVNHGPQPRSSTKGSKQNGSDDEGPSEASV